MVIPGALVGIVAHVPLVLFFQENRLWQFVQNISKENRLWYFMQTVFYIKDHFLGKLKAPYSSKIDIFIQERFNKLIYSINTIINCGIWQPVKFQLVSLSFLNWIKNEIIFYLISELMLATLSLRYDKKSFHFKNKRLTEILKAVRCHILCLYQYHISIY